MRLTYLRGALVLGAGLLSALPAAAQEEGGCLLLCTPDLKIEPTVTLENLGRRARIEVDGTVERTPRETVFEVIFAVGVPTEIPRVGLTFEAIVAPFGGTSRHPFTGVAADDLGREEIRDNPVEIESELNLDLFGEESTGGWLSSQARRPPIP